MWPCWDALKIIKAPLWQCWWLWTDYGDPDFYDMSLSWIIA